MKSREEIDREIDLYNARQDELKIADQIERESLRTSWAWKHPAKPKIERPPVWDKDRGKWHL